jgi:hypothetical protein
MPFFCYFSCESNRFGESPAPYGKNAATDCCIHQQQGSMHFLPVFPALRATDYYGSKN